MREANVIDFDEVLAVVLESTGDISVLHSSEKSRLQSKLLKGVEGLPKDAGDRLLTEVMEEKIIGMLAGYLLLLQLLLKL